jgi:hypothetical protein
MVNPFLFIRGLSCPGSVQTSLTQNCLKLTILGFPYNLFPVSCGDIGFFTKSIGQILAWKSAFSMCLYLGPSCPPQTILLSKFEFKKVCQTAITFCSGARIYPTGWTAQPSEDLSRHFFQGQRKPLRTYHSVYF